MKLTVGIVNYNSFDMTKKLIDSIKKFSPPFSFEIIVLDNNSNDGSASKLKKLNSIKVIRKCNNVGFGRGCNDISKRSKGEYLLFLNPDILVTKNSIKTLVDFMDKNKDCGIASGKLLNMDGTLQYSCRRFPTIFNVFFGRETFFSKILPTNYFTRRYQYMNMDYSKNNYVDWLRGCVFMVRRELFERLGGFDERFFLFLEDTDFCLRVKREGLKVCYIANVVFYHKLGGTTKLNPFKSKLIHNYSMFKYFKKYKGGDIFFLIFLNFAFLTRVIFLMIIETMERIKK